MINIDEIINDCKDITDGEKELFSNLFKELSREQNDVIDEVKKMVSKEFDFIHTKKNYDIVTALYDEEEFDSKRSTSLKPMINKQHKICKTEQFELKVDDDIHDAGVVFLDCSYDEKDNYLEKVYQAKVTNEAGTFDVDYRFYTYSGYYKNEKLISEIALQYDLKIPSIYSPMSRRAVSIIVDFNDEIEPDSDVKIDLQFQLNKLEDVVLINKILVWNVDIKQKEDLKTLLENTNNSMTKTFNKGYKIFEFEQNNNEYIYFLNEKADVRRTQSKIYIGVDEDVDPDNIDFCKVEILPIKNHDEDNNYYFKSIFNEGENYNFKTRILSDGDLTFVIKQFNQLNYLGSSRTVSSDDIKIYASYDEYYYPKKLKFRNTKNNRCYIKFEKETGKYFNDKINFLIAYLNYYYPEFYFVGVI